MKELKFYRNKEDLKALVLLQEENTSVMLDEKFIELKANTTDAAVEKHVPAVSMEGDTLTVVVGSVEHPMTEEHFIQFVVVETETGYQIEYLQPNQKPVAKFRLESKPVAVYEYCNLHGLWKAVL